MSISAKTSVLVVGQGLAGTVLAWQLYYKNIPFRIIAAPKGNQSSIVAAGMVNPLVFKRLTQSWMADILVPNASSFYKQCEKETQAEFYHHLPILKPLSEQETFLWQKKQDQPEIRPFLKSITKENPAKGLRTFHAYGTVSHSAYLNTTQFLELSQRFFEEQNCFYKEELDYTSLNVLNDRVHYNNLQARYVVLCDGHRGVNNLWYPKSCFNLCKGELLLIKSSELSQDYIVNRGVFVLPLGNELFKVGSTYEWENLDESTSEEAEKNLTDRLDQLIDVDYQIIDQFAGIRPTIKDRRPLIGFHPQHASLAYFNGMGTKGVMIAPYFAGLLGNILGGHDENIPLEVDIQRFFE